MDVHTENFTFASYEYGKEDVFAVNQVIGASWKDAIKYMKTLQKQRSEEKIHFVCGYEAGCFGYSLYNELMAAAITEKDLSLQCVILAPTTMAIQGNAPKTDRRDARMIAKNLAYGTYSSVYVVSEEDNGFDFRNFNVDGIGRFAVVWNNNKWYAGASAVVRAYNYRKSRFAANNVFGDLCVYVGLNFGPRGDYKKSKKK